MVVENTVARVGWFGAKVYAGTPVFEDQESFVRIKIGSFRPKYVVSHMAGKLDSTGSPTELVHCYVVPCANVGTDESPEWVAKLYLYDKSGVQITAADSDIKYSITLME